MSAEPEPLLLNALDPWPGLLSFSEENQEFFKGRTEDSAELAQLVKRDTLTVLTGQSGLGKTSLLNAGLFPLLRQEDFLPMHLRLDIAEASPDFVEQMRDKLRVDLARHQVQGPDPQSGVSLWEYFHRRGIEFWGKRNRLLTPVLVLDQFEELFTLTARSRLLEARRQMLFAALTELIVNRPPPSLVRILDEKPERAEDYDHDHVGYRILLSLREDFLPEFESQLKPLLGAPLRNHKRLTRMKGNQAVQVVAEAGREVVVPQAVEPIVRFVAGGRAGLFARESERLPLPELEVEPALLSLVCSELNHKRRADQRITANLLEAEEESIIAGFYERSLRDLAPEVKVFIEDQLLTDSGYRDSYAWDDAARVPGVSEDALETLVKRRILRKEEHFGTLRVELTHDLLTRVIRESRDVRQAREAQAQAEEAARLAERRILAERRVRRMWVIAFGLMTVLMLGSVFFGKRAMDAGREADAKSRLVFSQQLTERARLLFASRPDLAWLVAEEAYRHPETQAHRGARNPEAKRLLFDSELLVTPNLNRYFERDAGEATRMNGLALSPDGRLLVGAERAPRVRFWDATTGRVLRSSQEDHRGAVNAVAFSPDGKLVAAAGANGSIHLIDPGTGKRVGEPLVEHESAVTAVAFHPNGRRLASGGRDGRVVVWTLGSEPPARQTVARLEAPVLTLAFNPDGNKLGWGSRKTATLWDLDKGRQIKTLPLKQPITRIAISPTRPRLAVATEAGGVHVFPLAGEGAVRDISDAHASAVAGLAYSPDGRWLVSAGRDEAVAVWDTENYGVVTRLSGAHSSAVVSALFSADGKLVFSAEESGAVVEWVIAPRGAPVRMLADPATPYRRAAFSRDGTHVAAVGERTVTLWEAKQGKKVWTQSLGDDASDVRDVRFSPDGRMLAITLDSGVAKSRQGAVLLMDTQTRVLRRASVDEPTMVAFNAAGTEFVAASRHDGRSEFKRFRVDGEGLGMTAITLDMSWQQILALGFSANGTEVLAVHRWGVVQFPTAGSVGKPVMRMTDGVGVEAAALSTDGSILATAHYGGDAPWIALRDAKTAKQTARIDVAAPIADLEFSADGRLLAALDQRKRIVLWDVETLREIAEPFASRSYADMVDVRMVAFSPGGTALLAAGRRVLLADVGRETGEFFACARAQRNLSTAEWSFFMGTARYRQTCLDYGSGERKPD